MLRLIIPLLFLFSAPLQAIVILPREESPGEKMGKAFSEAFSKSMEEARQIALEKKLREQLEQESRKAAEMDFYNSMLNQLSYEPSHTTLSLLHEFTVPFVHEHHLRLADAKKIRYIFKRSFNRVISSGTLVEWLWSVDIWNETQKKIFSSGTMDYSHVRLKIELLDSNQFALSSCVMHTNLHLKRGELRNLQGKWVIPYDQVGRVSNYRIYIDVSD